MSDSLEKLCQKYDLHLLEALPGSSSDYVAKVEMSNGEIALFKSVDKPEYEFGELLTLQAWENSPWTPNIIKNLDPGVHLRQWVDGMRLDEMEDGGAHLASSVARALGELHLPVTGSLRELPTTLSWLEEQRIYLQGAVHITNHEKEIVDDLLAEILTHPKTSVLLHGDAYYRNILYDDKQLWFIDPRGRQGPPAYDLACFISMTPCNEPLSIIEAVEEGYAKPLPYLRELTLVFALRALEKFRDEHGLAGREEEWRALSNSLMDVI